MNHKETVNFRIAHQTRWTKDPTKKRLPLRTTISPESQAWLYSVWEHSQLSQGAMIDHLIKQYQASDDCPEWLK